MAKAPTKTKLHDQLEAVILNTRRIIDEKVEARLITKTRAEQLRSEIQKQIEAALNVLDQQTVEAIYLQVHPRGSSEEAFEYVEADS